VNARQRVALTFDDGPDPDGTRRVLEVLAAHEIPATFFIWGEQARRHPDVVAEVVGQGHTVAPHCSRHASHHSMSAREIAVDIDALLALLRELDVPTPSLWRTPYGHVRRPATREIARRRGLALVGWTIDSRDYSGGSAGEMHAAVTGELAEAPDAVATILMHDSASEPEQSQARDDVSQTVELVRRLVSDARYEFVPVAGEVLDGLIELAPRARWLALPRRVARRVVKRSR
jgi:peptidoglycan/xylan/chitin deacetylase (PgdA/CDA1 family)